MWIIFSLLAAFSAAVAFILTKAGLKKVDPILGFAIQAILILVVSWSVTFFQKKSTGLSQIDQRSWMFLIGAGIITCLSSLFQFSALKLCDSSVVSSLEKLSLVFAIILAVIFLKEEMNQKVVAGAMLMIGGAVLISLSIKAG